MNRKQRRSGAAQAARGSGGGTQAGAEFSAADALAFLTGAAARKRPVQGGPRAQPQGYVFDSVYASTRSWLVAGRGMPRLLETVSEAQAFSEKVWAGAQSRPGAVPEGKIACRKGCAWCCHQQVSISGAEAIAIADHVRRHFAPERLAALRGRLDDLDERTRGMGPSEYAATASPCAFLEEGACSIHAARPLRCRAYHSVDADYCRWKFEHPAEAAAERRENRVKRVYPAEPVRIFDGALRGMATAMRDAGLPAGALHLTGALRIALAEPDAGEAWLNGKPVFAAALIPPDILAADLAQAPLSGSHPTGKTGAEAPHAECQETPSPT